MSILAVTMSMMEREKSDIIVQNGHGHHKNRRNAMGNIFKDMNQDAIFDRLVFKELDVSNFDNDSETQHESDTKNDDHEEAANRFG